MDDKYYKLFNPNGTITTIYTNDSYNIITDFNKNGLSTARVDYGIHDSNLLTIKLLSDLLKTNKQLDKLIVAINELISSNMISMEVGSYLMQILYEDKENVKKL